MTGVREAFAALPPAARDALREILLGIRLDALALAEKSRVALYWKCVGVYAGHLARINGRQ